MFISIANKLSHFIVRSILFVVRQGDAAWQAPQKTAQRLHGGKSLHQNAGIPMRYDYTRRSISFGKSRYRLCVCLALSLAITEGWAGGVQNHNEIIEAVQIHLQDIPELQQQNTRLNIGQIDRRLKLTQCDQPLETFMAPGARTLGKTSVGVRCNGEKPWRIYVSATIDQFAMVYQSSRPLTRGHIVNEEDITLVERNLSQLPYGYILDKNAIMGKQLKRSLQAARVVTPNHLQEPILIKRGDKVILVVRSSGFAIRSEGIAMMNGAAGESIRVKNSSSKRIVEGTVTRTGEVTVHF